MVDRVHGTCQLDIQTESLPVRHSHTCIHSIAYAEVVLAVPAAAYVKSQAYVPLVQSRYADMETFQKILTNAATTGRSAHFIDPALRAILETSLTPDDNDLFLTNLLDTPVLAVHG